MLSKTEFIARFAAKGYTKAAAGVIVDDFVDLLTEIMAEDEGVRFIGFGTFDVRHSADKEMLDYRTKKTVLIPGHKAPRFTPGKVLKRVVREGSVNAQAD